MGRALRIELIGARLCENEEARRGRRENLENAVAALKGSENGAGQRGGPEVRKRRSSDARKVCESFGPPRFCFCGATEEEGWTLNTLICCLLRRFSRRCSCSTGGTSRRRVSAMRSCGNGSCRSCGNSGCASGFRSSCNRSS